MSDSFEWKGKKIVTYGDIGKCITSIKTREEAQEFLALYKSDCEYAEHNIGYISGYYDNETASRIRDLFHVHHPIFGNKNPSPEEALEAGKKMAQDKNKQGEAK